MSALWTSTDAAAATGGNAQQDWQAYGLAIDSREVKEGDLFIALQGITDGHKWVKSALDNGAAAVLVSDHTVLPDNAPAVIVKDTFKALQDLGIFARKRAKDLIAIGITGSVGKTGTKEMLRTVLSIAGTGHVHAAVQSFNNHWGVPLTLARMPANTRYGIFEIGMNAPNEITPLSKMCALDIAMITTVEPVHLAGFSHVDEIAKAKAEIFDGLSKNGTAILNMDNRYFDYMKEAARALNIENIKSFGTVADADSFAKNITVSAATTVVDAVINKQELLFKIMASGRHLAMNAMGVMSVASAAGVDLAKVGLAMAHWQLPEGRGLRWRIVSDDAPDLQNKSSDEFILIDESYNANPTSMHASFEAFALTEPETNHMGKKGRRIIMLTDMLELGEKAPEMHKDLAHLPIIKEFDLVYVAGPLMKCFYDALPAKQQGGWYEDADALVANVGQMVGTGDAIMVKGSKGSQAFKIAAMLKRLGSAEQI